MAISPDGSTILAARNGVIWTLDSTAPAPALVSARLSIGMSGANMLLSWLVPSRAFVLQQNSDLTSTGWADVTNQPILDFNTLHNEVTLPLSAGKTFYRLKQE